MTMKHLPSTMSHLVVCIERCCVISTSSILSSFSGKFRMKCDDAAGRESSKKQTKTARAFDDVIDWLADFIWQWKIESDYW